MISSGTVTHTFEVLRPQPCFEKYEIATDMQWYYAGATSYGAVLLDGVLCDIFVHAFFISYLLQKKFAQIFNIWNKSNVYLFRAAHPAM